MTRSMTTLFNIFGHFDLNAIYDAYDASVGDLCKPICKPRPTVEHSSVYRYVRTCIITKLGVAFL
jgi:hypothetical protein